MLINCLLKKRIPLLPTPMLSRLSTTLLFVLAGLLPSSVVAQSTLKEEDAVRKTIDRLFDAMRAGDSSEVRAVFMPDAQLSTLSGTSAPETIAREGIAGFLKAVGTPRPKRYDERIHNVQIKIDGPMAMAWVPYSFFLGDTFSHCGVNAMLLVRSREGQWRIQSILDTRRKEDCP